MTDSNTIIIKSFPIPDGWQESANRTVTVDMPPFTKIISAGYDRNEILVVWGVVRSGWDNDRTVDYTIHIRGSNEKIESTGETATFIDMVTINDKPHAIFVGGVTT